MASHATHRLPVCPNCGFDFAASSGPDAFCPQCGQPNHPLDISFGHVVEETLEGIFHFDGKFFSTVRALFMPGRLTRHFNEGRRMPFVPPIRLYVFISFVFFLLLALVSGHDRRTVQEVFAGGNRGTKLSADSVLNTIPIQADAATQDSVRQQLREALTQRNRPNVNVTTGAYWNYTQADVEAYQRRPTPAHLDSLLRSHGHEPSFGNRLTFRQYARFQTATVDEARQRILKNTSVALFFLMPVFALLLKVLYLRQKRFYLNHLIFSLHLHSFILTLFIVSVLWNHFLHNDWYMQLLLWVPPLYLVVALRHVYQQSWRKSTAKALLLMFSYAFVLTFGILTTLVVGAALL
ncbi:DUF3667 domain-containing protein [Hymenobacter busanensis]|uniref:DUF3667 domain-containing protein n=1 Tax=Hymenobacter busanensis TaxID=2607656 RepID=A0A7L5A052_9BACT|nr:DUF3667 domain-containing protein [Hymenobacter busanensis]KAA9331409.1 DUF3667 domain-containing protein [Hymenobacter busanensis]QHJ08563.1 DUF3667 domain-containing protein [Hymenobacter busanensis]